ncbi:hypothetical protein BD626DRAFT_568485 [Schizophyllum amplum]|uniref:Uncharacterized protein n=1 Tax=Schizophyllum amplum TaxID=97359 RepID=A0A550CGD5_9AGAR|nr:hypothetical protein BD626DRAFT_568485 [Auriculariopsis ampla]
MTHQRFFWFDQRCVTCEGWAPNTPSIHDRRCKQRIPIIPLTRPVHLTRPRSYSNLAKRDEDVRAPDSAPPRPSALASALASGTPRVPRRVSFSSPLPSPAATASSPVGPPPPRPPKSPARPSTATGTPARPRVSSKARPSTASGLPDAHVSRSNTSPGHKNPHSPPPPPPRRRTTSMLTGPLRESTSSTGSGSGTGTSAAHSHGSDLHLPPLTLPPLSFDSYDLNTPTRILDTPLALDNNPSPNYTRSPGESDQINPAVTRAVAPSLASAQRTRQITQEREELCPWEAFEDAEEGQPGAGAGLGGRGPIVEDDADTLPPPHSDAPKTRPKSVLGTMGLRRVSAGGIAKRAGTLKGKGKDKDKGESKDKGEGDASREDRARDSDSRLFLLGERGRGKALEKALARETELIAGPPYRADDSKPRIPAGGSRSGAGGMRVRVGASSNSSTAEAHTSHSYAAHTTPSYVMHTSPAVPYAAASVAHDVAGVTHDAADDAHDVADDTHDVADDAYGAAGGRLQESGAGRALPSGSAFVGDRDAFNLDLPHGLLVPNRAFDVDIVCVSSVDIVYLFSDGFDINELGGAVCVDGG